MLWTNVSVESHGHVVGSESTSCRKEQRHSHRTKAWPRTMKPESSCGRTSQRWHCRFDYKLSATSRCLHTPKCPSWRSETARGPRVLCASVALLVGVLVSPHWNISISFSWFSGSPEDASVDAGDSHLPVEVEMFFTSKVGDHFKSPLKNDR